MDLVNRLQSMVTAWRTPTEEDHAEFLQIKDSIYKAIRLHAPDYSKSFYLHTDSSMVGIGAYLFQVDEQGNELPLRFLSQRYSDQARRWCTTEQEAYAVYKGILGCQDIVRGHLLTLRTDHRALVFMQNSTNAKVIRWAIALSTYRFEVEHIPGRTNLIADFLSRYWQAPHIKSTEASEVAIIQTESTDEGIPEEPELQPANALNHIDLELLDIKASNGFTAARKIEIIQNVHNSFSGHHGIGTTLKILKSNNYKWDHIRHDVQSYIRACGICQKANHHGHTLPATVHHLWHPEIFHTIQMDVLKGLPTSTDGFTSILVLVDCMSRYCVLYPLKGETAQETAHKLVDFMGHYGRPHTFVSDGGANFISNLSKAMATFFGYDIHITDAHRPSAHGIVERLNKEVQQHLRALHMESVGKDWAQLVPCVQFIINNFISGATGFAPRSLVFGAQPDSARFIAPKARSSSMTAFTMEEAYPYIHALDSHLLKIRNASVAFQDALLDQKLTQVRPQESLPLNTLVLYSPTKTQLEPWRKLTPRWLGPAKVTAAIDGRYELQDLLSKSIVVRDSTEIKRFHVGVNPLLLNSMDSKLEIVLEILSHQPLNHKKSHPKSKLKFQIIILQADGVKVQVSRSYADLKDRLLFSSYCENHGLQHLLHFEGKRKPPQPKDTFMS